MTASDSDAETATERERIRREKAERLRETIEGDGGSAAASSPAERPSATPDEPIHVEGESEFRSVLADHDVVLVDFHADWCGPCQMLEPTVASLAAETDAAVAKVDVDANQALAGQYGVRGVPNVIVFADGEPVEQFVGVRGREEYERVIDAQLGA